jgi:hypothetical protein
MAAETQYTSNIGTNVISVANSNLDGVTGTYYDIITGASNGTLVKSVTVKAQVSTTQGMVRLFVYDGTNARLVSEIEVPATTKDAETPSFEISLQTNFSLKSGHKLRASTQNAEAFCVIAEGLDWAYYATSVRPESSNFTANTGMVNISTANSNLNGTGTLGTVITAGVAASGWKGCEIDSIVVQATSSTTAGMIRLYISDLLTFTRIFKEIPVSAMTPSSTAPGFTYVEKFKGLGFMLKAGLSIVASTEKGESFNIFAEGADWKYPA